MRKAAQRVSGAPDEPNVILALASSYNERGVTGYTHSVTNSEDQRKINCLYELAKNSMTGKGTLTLTKRPGVTVEGNNWGTSTQDVFLIIKGGATPVGPWIVVKIGNDIKLATTSGLSWLILTSSTHNPAFIDKTAIANVENTVVQLRRTSASFVQRVFYADVSTTWTEITDADFTAIAHIGKMEHMDGYAFIMDSLNKIWNSDVNSIANWTATSFITKQLIRDRAVGLAKLGKQIIAFGEESAEPFYNAGNTTGSPLLPIGHLAQRIGMVAPDISLVGAGSYYCVIGNKMYFVGRESGGRQDGFTYGNSIGVYVYDGQQFAKISSVYIDKILGEVATTSFYSVNTFGVNGQVAAAFLLTSPNATSQRWLMYFPEWKEWFEWTSSDFSSINASGYFLPCKTSTKDRIYYFANTDNWQDNGTSYAWSTQFKLPTNGASLKFMPMYGVDADTDTSANNLTIEISTNDCVSFSTLGTIDQTQDRKLLFGGGSFRKAHIRLGNTNARPSRIHNWLARIE